MKLCTSITSHIACLLLFMASSFPAYADFSFSDAVTAYEKADYEKARTIFARLAELGHHDAQFNMGVLYHLGQGVNQDNVHAYAWFSLAAESGSQNWIDIRDKVYATLSPIRKIEASELRDSLIYSYGRSALNMSLIPELTQADISYCEIKKTKWQPPIYPRTAISRGRQGWVDVSYSISRYGDVKDIVVLESVPRDEFVAATMKAVRGFKYDPPLVNGKNEEIHGVHQRVKFAIEGEKSEEYKKKLNGFVSKLLQKAETGDPVHQYLYGYVMIIHPDLLITKHEANEWYLKAAQGGYPPAQYAIGRSLMYGLGCEHDNTKSVEWLTLSAKADYPHAQVLLGKSLLSRGHDKKNLKQGLFWLEKAADNNFLSARMTLAWTYATFYDASLRNPARALELAKSSYKEYYDEVTGFETIAAAYAVIGDYKQAVKFQNKALKEARGLEWTLTSIKDRLDAYSKNRPWFQSENF